MNQWNWKEFLWKALVRAIRTFAQTFAAGITIGALWTEIQWMPALSAAGVASVYSILMSIVTGLPEVDKTEPDEKEDEAEDE